MAIGKKLMLCILIFFQAPGTPKKVLDISGKSPCLDQFYFYYMFSY